MSLSDHDHDRLVNFYQESFQAYGDHDARSVRWQKDADQQTRFRVLTQVGNLDGRQVLDVGCGLGDLYKFFLSHEMSVDYTGIDVVPEFIEASTRRYPEAHFLLRDVFEINQHYPYILASGALSFKVANNATVYQSMIRHMYELADIAVAFNMLDRRVHSDDAIYAAYDPEEIADFCSTFATRVEIAVDYLPQDFAVFLYK
jgi:trans-aconitate methyltransferase